MNLKLNDEEWTMIVRELPRGSDLRSKCVDLRDDAMTWGEAEDEFDADEITLLKTKVGFDWLDEVLNSPCT